LEYPVVMSCDDAVSPGDGPLTVKIREGESMPTRKRLRRAATVSALEAGDV
jgi:hypothetical protein